MILFKLNNIFAIRKSGNNKYSYVAELDAIAVEEIPRWNAWGENIAVA